MVTDLVNTNGQILISDFNKKQRDSLLLQYQHALLANQTPKNSKPCG